MYVCRYFSQFVAYKCSRSCGYFTLLAYLGDLGFRKYIFFLHPSNKTSNYSVVLGHMASWSERGHHVKGPVARHSVLRIEKSNGYLCLQNLNQRYVVTELWRKAKNATADGLQNALTCVVDRKPLAHTTNRAR